MNMNIRFMNFSGLETFTSFELKKYKLIYGYSEWYLELLPIIFEYEDLAMQILQSRKNIGINIDGVSLKEYAKIIGLSGNEKSNLSKYQDQPFANTDYRVDLQQGLKKEVDRLHRIFQFHKEILRQLPHVILGNVFVPRPGCPIAWDYVDEPYQHIEINILLNISKNEFLKYIKSEWDLIESEMKKLPGKPAAAGRPKKDIPASWEIRLMELKDNGASFPEIINIMGNELSNDDFGNLSKTYKNTRKFMEKYMTMY